MAGVGINIVGSLTDNEGSRNVTITGIASLEGLHVGGGPIDGGEGPPSIWPSPGHPAHPIHIPDEIWPNPPEGQAPIPEHPIVLPHPPQIQGPDLQVKVVWTASEGWAVVLVPAGTAPAPSGGRRR